MYKVFVRFTLMSHLADESIGYFKSIPECKKFINSFPNVTHWSISPLKELDFADIKSEVFDKIDLDSVSEISIRIRHGY